MKFIFVGSDPTAGSWHSVAPETPNAPLTQAIPAVGPDFTGLPLDQELTIWMLAFGFCLVWWTVGFIIWLLRRPKIKGALGEARVRRVLNRMARSDGFLALHDVTLPVQDHTTQIDHILLSPQGVFVIETKNFAGRIYGGPDQPRWTQVLGRKKRPFYNPLRQNEGHCKAVAEVLGLASPEVHSIVCFVGTARPKTEMPDNVVWRTSELRAALETARPSLWRPQKVAALAADLEAARLAPGRVTNQHHIQNLRARGI